MAGVSSQAVEKLACVPHDGLPWSCHSRDAPMRPTSRLRQLLAQPGAIVAPGVADALNARLVARHGFDAVYMTGAGTTATRLRMPDVGLLTITEMVDNAARIADASRLPTISDADTCYVVL